jgi:serine protease Do
VPPFFIFAKQSTPCQFGFEHLSVFSCQFLNMKLVRSFVGISTAALALTAAIVAVRMVARALDTNPAVRVDNSPINRDPHSGNSYSPVVKKVAPSVVNIYSTRFVKERYYSDPLMANPFYRHFFGDQFSDEGQEVTRRDNWLGSGMIVTPDGYILTANHVVEGADEIKVGIQNDKTEYAAKVIGMDPPTDVAILKIEAKNLPAVTLGDSDQLEVGDVVLAIGNPFGIGQTVTRGIISALSRSITDPNDPNPYGRQYQDFIQTDASINEGNSGGALVDAEGRLIGINDAMISPSGTSAGIGLAVPINMARNVMEGFLNGGRVARGYLGIDMQDIDDNLAKGFGAPTADGALVTVVGPDSPAAKAGVVAGDVIVAINDKPVTGADNLRLVISQLHPGSQAKLKIFRNGVSKIMAVTIAERLDISRETTKPNDSMTEKPQADELGGVIVQNLTPRLRHQLRASPDLAGALVTDIGNNSSSFDADLRRWDVVVEINHQPVANAEDAVRLWKAAASGQILVKVWRPTREGGITRFLSVDNARRTQ